MGWPQKHTAQITVVWREGWPMYDLYVVLDGVEVFSIDPNVWPLLVLKELSDLLSSSWASSSSTTEPSSS